MIGYFKILLIMDRERNSKSFGPDKSCYKCIWYPWNQTTIVIQLTKEPAQQPMPRTSATRMAGRGNWVVCRERLAGPWGLPLALPRVVTSVTTSLSLISHLVNFMVLVNLFAKLTVNYHTYFFKLNCIIVLNYSALVL